MGPGPGLDDSGDRLQQCPRRIANFLVHATPRPRGAHQIRYAPPGFLGIGQGPLQTPPSRGTEHCLRPAAKDAPDEELQSLPARAPVGLGVLGGQLPERGGALLSAADLLVGRDGRTLAGGDGLQYAGDVGIVRAHHIQLIGEAAAGRGDVRGAAAGALGEQAVAPLDSDALRTVHGGRVSEFRLAGEVVGGQNDPPSVPGVPCGDVPVGESVFHPPQVAVLHPVVSAQDRQAPLVAPGHQHVAHVGVHTSSYDDLLLVVEPPSRQLEGLCAGVEIGDGAGVVGDHQRAGPGLAVALPRGEDFVDHRLVVTAAHAPGLQVPVEGLGRISFAQFQRGACLTVGTEAVEPLELDDPDRRVQPAQHAA